MGMTTHAEELVWMAQNNAPNLSMIKLNDWTKIVNDKWTLLYVIEDRID